MQPNFKQWVNFTAYFHAYVMCKFGGTNLKLNATPLQYVTFILMPTFVNARLFPANRLKAHSVVTGCNLDNREMRVA